MKRQYFKPSIDGTWLATDFYSNHRALKFKPKISQKEEQQRKLIGNMRRHGFK